MQNDLDILHYVTRELSAWLTDRCKDKVEMANWARRWGLSLSQLEKFMSGKTDIPVSAAVGIAKDTEIPLNRLNFASSVAKALGEKPKLEPRRVGEGHNVRMLLLSDVYKPEIDFKGNTLWLRAAESVTIPPAASAEVWFPADIRILDYDAYVPEFKVLQPETFFGRLRNTPDGLIVSLLTFDLKSATLKRGQRVGLLRLGVEVPMAHFLYDIPDDVGPRKAEEYVSL